MRARDGGDGHPLAAAARTAGHGGAWSGSAPPPTTTWSSIGGWRLALPGGRRACLTDAAVSRVVVVGSINVDLVVAADHLPRPGETVLGGQLRAPLRGQGGEPGGRGGASRRLGDDGGCRGTRRRRRRVASRAYRRKGSTSRGCGASTRRPGWRSSPSPRTARTRSWSPPARTPRSRPRDAALADLPDGPGVLLTCLEIPMPSVVAAVAAAARIGLRSVVNPAPGQRLPAEAAGEGHRS